MPLVLRAMTTDQLIAEIADPGPDLPPQAPRRLNRLAVRVLDQPQRRQIRGISLGHLYASTRRKRFRRRQGLTQ